MKTQIKKSFQAKIGFKLHNRFDVFIKNAETGEEKQVAYAENIILDGLWSVLLNHSSLWFKSINYGTGTGALDPARTTLFTYLSRKTAGGTTWGADVTVPWWSVRKSITMTEVEHVGSVLREVGISADSTTIYTHALLMDMEGNPVAITKTNLDIITIYATVYCMVDEIYAPDMEARIMNMIGSENPLISNLCGSPIGDGYSSGYFGPPRLLSYYSGDCPQNYNASDGHLYVCGNPGNGLGDYASWTVDAANKKATAYFRLPAAQGNAAGGIKGISCNGYGHRYAGDNIRSVAWFRFPVAIHTQDTCTNEQIGTGDGVTKNFATAFPFVKSGAVIKLDGVEELDVTVFEGLPGQTNIKAFMKLWGVNGDNGYMPRTNLFPYGSNAYDVIVENPFYATYGIDTMVVSYATVYKSSDKINWTQVYSTGSASQTYTVGAGDKQSRYWKFAKSGANAFTVTSMNCAALATFKNVQFTDAPAEGAVITATYDTDVIIKDVNHVHDFTFIIQLGEYDPEGY